MEEVQECSLNSGANEVRLYPPPSTTMASSKPLANKIAVITGAGSGIGKAAAVLFAEQGAKVAICARREERLEETSKDIAKLGGEVLIHACDVSKPEDVSSFFEAVTEKWGKRIDILCAHAGVNGVWAPIEELQPDEFDHTVAINMRGTFLTVRAAVPYMKQHGGVILVTSSINGTRQFGKPGAAIYGATKGAVLAFAKVLAVELGKHRIRVNAVCPGLIGQDTLIMQEQTEQRHIEHIQIKKEARALRSACQALCSDRRAGTGPARQVEQKFALTDVDSKKGLASREARRAPAQPPARCTRSDARPGPARPRPASPGPQVAECMAFLASDRCAHVTGAPAGPPPPAAPGPRSDLAAWRAGTEFYIDGGQTLVAH
eukprot:tig00000219_g19504.t1